MRLYLDTEFTDLVTDPRLISIGLVADDYRWFYSEIDSDHWYKKASEFVLAEVWPQMHSYRTHFGQETIAQAAKRLGQWVTKLGEPAQIWCDSDYDWDLLKILLGNEWPANLEREKWVDASRIECAHGMPQAKRDYLLRYGLRAHHALNDAQALRFAVEAVEMATQQKKGGRS